MHTFDTHDPHFRLRRHDAKLRRQAGTELIHPFAADHASRHHGAG